MIMGMSGGYEVDVDALTAAAGAATRIAGDAEPVVDRVGVALKNISVGASGSRSAAAAESAAGQWPNALRRQVGQIGDVGDKLASSARDYLGRDTAAATAIDTIASAAMTGETTGRIAGLLSGE